jgi:hypothetical protein
MNIIQDGNLLIRNIKPKKLDFTKISDDDFAYRNKLGVRIKENLLRQIDVDKFSKDCV